MKRRFLCFAACLLCAFCSWAETYEPHVKAVVERILSNVEKIRAVDPSCVPMAFWDFDGTIIRGDIGFGLVENGAVRYRGLIEEALEAGFVKTYACVGGCRQWRTDYARMAEIGPWLSQAYDAQMFAGVRAAELDAFCEKTIRKKRLTDWYFASSVAIWRALAGAGVENYILSANVEALVRNVASTLDIPRERIRGSRVECEDGCWTVRFVPPVPHGDGKTALLREIVRNRPHGRAVAAFGNSYATDGAFLRFVAGLSLPGAASGTAVMINGGNPPACFDGAFICVRQDAVVKALNVAETN